MMPPQIAASLGRMVNYCLPARLQVRNPSDKAALVREVLLASSPAEVYRTLIGHWKRPCALLKRPECVDPDWLPFPPSCSADPWVDMMTTDLQQYLPDDILTKVDRTSMSVGLEVRVPLLDHRLVALAWRLPLHMKMRDDDNMVG